MSRVRLVPIILIAVVTIAVLFGGWQAYQHFNLLQPLQTKLQQVDGVKSVQIDTGNNGDITVQLGPVSKLENQDLQTTYDNIAERVQDILGGSTNLVLEDHRSPELSSLYEEVYMPILMKGLANADYPAMTSAVLDKAKSDGIAARITMDKHNVYVQLSKGGYYLYDVLPLTTIRQGGVAS